MSPGPQRPRGRRRRGRDDEHDPEEVGGVVRAVLQRLGVAGKVERARAAAEWEEIVGPRIAEVTGDVRVKGRTLVVEVESASWMSELDMMRHQLLRKLNEGKESGRIEKIVFVQAEGR